MPHAILKPEHVTLAVLAGGAGSRMGVQKGLLRVGDEPILTWLLAKFDWPGPTLLVTAPDTAPPPGADRFDHHATDAATGNGPLQGVLTALEHATTPAVVVVTVDMPRIDKAKLLWLIDQLSPSTAGVMCRRRIAESEQIEPFPCALQRTSIDLVRQHLATGRRSVHGLCREAAIQAIHAPPDWPEHTWLNLNHPEQFAAFHAAEIPSEVERIP